MSRFNDIFAASHERDDEGPDEAEKSDNEDDFEILDPDACFCDNALTARVIHNNWNLILFYECLACGARWHYWAIGNIPKDKRDFAEALVELRRKIK